MGKLAALILAFWLLLPAFLEARKARHTAVAGKSTVTKRAGARQKIARHAVSSRSKLSRARTARGSSRSRNNKKRASWRGGQMTPTPERYKQIQQALVEQGYLKPPATGVWGPESTEALKRFQRDQKLEPNGKLNALSLITLGLGPRRDSNDAISTPANTPPGPSTRDPQ